jgi:hypothetical protein
MKAMKFKSEKEAIQWVRYHIPFAVLPKRPAKTTLVFPFSSQNAMDRVIEILGQELFKNQ